TLAERFGSRSSAGGIAMHNVMGGIALALSLAVSVAAQPPTPDKPPVVDEKKVKSSLEGDYDIISGERDGKAIPEARIQGGFVRIADGMMIGIDKDRKNVFTTTYTLNTTETPWKIEMKTIRITKADATEVPQDMKANGLIKKEGGTLTVIYALPGGEEPTE